MTPWSPSPEYLRISDANRRYYARVAKQYDATETCVVNAAHQAVLDEDLQHALSLLGSPPEHVKALDACGGSGNVALRLLERGVDVLLVDLSPELQELFVRKCQQRALRARVRCQEIASFLAEAGDTYDLITFSSALHHLQNYQAVLRLAFARLNPGGLLFTAFDPTLRSSLSRSSRMLLKADYYAFKAIHQTRDLPQAIRRRLSRVLRGVRGSSKASAPVDEATLGLLAEYHVEGGIDDLALARDLEAHGAQILRHERYAEARSGVARFLLRRLGAVTAFKLLLRRPDQRLDHEASGALVVP